MMRLVFGPSLKKGFAYLFVSPFSTAKHHFLNVSRCGLVTVIASVEQACKIGITFCVHI